MPCDPGCRARLRKRDVCASFVSGSQTAWHRLKRKICFLTVAAVVEGEDFYQSLVAGDERWYHQFDTETDQQKWDGITRYCPRKGSR